MPWASAKKRSGHTDEGHDDDVDSSVDQAGGEAIGHPPLHQLVLNHVIHRHGIHLVHHDAVSVFGPGHLELSPLQTACSGMWEVLTWQCKLAQCLTISLSVLGPVSSCNHV